MEDRERETSVGEGSAAPAEKGKLPEAPAKPVVHHRGPLRLVLVRWRDAWFDMEQDKLRGWRSEYLVQTVGFLVRDEPEVVSVAQELLPGHDGFRAITHIPRGVVESVATLYEEEGPGRRLGDKVLRREA